MRTRRPRTSTSTVSSRIDSTRPGRPKRGTITSAPTDTLACSAGSGSSSTGATGACGTRNAGNASAASIVSRADRRARGLKLQAQPVRFAPQLGQLFLGRRLRLLPHFAMLPLRVAQRCSRSSLQRGCLGRFLERACARILGGRALAGDLVEQRFGLARLRRNVRARGFEHLVGHAQPFGDGERVRPTRRADHESIRGRQRLKVELDAGVLHAFGGFGVTLQLGIVRGRDDVGAALAEKVQQGAGDGGALLRVGPGAELVEQDQRAAVRIAQHAHDARDVARERRQTLLQALLVADVGLDAGEDGEDGAFVGRHEQAGHGHERQQPGGLERDRLAARIRASDEQQVELVAEIERDRHDLAAQQRMACLEQLEHRLSGWPWQRHELGGCGALLFGERRAGSRQVKLCQAFDAREQRVRLLADGLTQRAQDAFDFAAPRPDAVFASGCPSRPPPAVRQTGSRRWRTGRGRCPGTWPRDSARMGMT